jgi:YesN/AraC family two-component response regulator
MEKILLNLLNNAFKYTPTGGRITVTTRADIRDFKSSYSKSFIATQAENKGSLFGVAVSDNGVGISETSIEHIFDRYYRVNESGGTQHLGSGIGLALVKSLVELHKGAIAVYSERDRGMDILIGFPADPSVYDETEMADSRPGNVLSDTQPFFEPATEAGKEEKVQEESLLKNKKTILLVEDNDELREYLADMLHELYDVKEVANGREALKLLDEEEADLVLTDVMMPYINGIELSKTLKEHIETSHIPVVMLTAKTGVENQIEGLYSGADVYLEKPVNKQVLLLNLANLFKQQQRIRDYYAKYHFAQPESNDTLVNKRDAEFMRRFIGVIEENLSNTGIDVLLVASSLAMSRRKLYGKVKALTGQSVVEFIRNYRLRKAAQLLVGEDTPISEVMEHVGIDNASYFSRIFKKEFGESPSDFAAKYHKH